jgi:hypothetical protein
MVEFTDMMIENAPSRWESPSSTWVSTDSCRDLAMRWTNVSESAKDRKIAPSSTNRLRRSRWFVRFPLWASASSPLAKRAVSGCTFEISWPPAVE